MPRNSRIQMVGKLEVRDIEALADETRELERELRSAWRQGQTRPLKTTDDRAQPEQRATSGEMTYSSLL
jgi:hypothetical protein